MPIPRRGASPFFKKVKIFFTPGYVPDTEFTFFPLAARHLSLDTSTHTSAACGYALGSNVSLRFANNQGV
jgi:hypothetical protein